MCSVAKRLNGMSHGGAGRRTSIRSPPRGLCVAYWISISDRIVDALLGGWSSTRRSLFTQEEQEGFEDACQLVPAHDFVAFGRRKIQFYRTGDYPPLRGTYVKFSDNEFALYTDGYIPFLRTYPGVRVPQPLDIMQHIGDSPWNTVLREVIGLTKMNWNTADFACSKPITIAFSRKVGEILAELPVDVDPEHNYRFYM